MAKDQRFPSDANKPAPAAVAAKAADVKAAAIAKAAPPMAKKAPELVAVQYGLKNHHFMEMVHHLAPGLNQVPKEVWERAKKHPAMQALMKAGHVKEIGGKEAAAPAPAAEDAE